MNNSKQELKLLPLNDLIKTGTLDHADWNYKFLLGYIQRKRFKLILNLIKNYHFKDLLEIGYGSGVFIPQLADYAENIYGIDIHTQNNSIMDILSKHEVKAELFLGDAVNLPFKNNSFDGIISVSAMEFIDNLEVACSEIKRVLKKNGQIFVVTPGHSKLLDLGLKLLTGQSAQKDFEGKREKTIPTLTKNFEIKKRLFFPKFNLGIKVYTALQLSSPK